MRAMYAHNGSVMLIAVFAIALLSVLVMGMLQMNTEEIQIAQNQVFAAEALAIAEAGLNDAFSQLRVDSSWNAGFAGKSFDGGSYEVDVNDSTVISTGTSSKGFVGRIEADIIVGSTSPHVIQINHFRVNE